MTTPTIQDLIRNPKALFVVNHSGGKDSQAMYLVIRAMVPADRIVVVHADLGEVEWAGLKDHIKANIDGHQLHVAEAVYADGSPKTLLGEWDRKGKAPSPSQKWCTSDLKRDPIAKVVRRLANERGCDVVVNCMGLRSGESCDRAKLEPMSVNKRATNTKRTVYDWLPIHTLTTAEVFSIIANAGQQPHPMYAMGMSRLSCCFCIMGSKGDLTRAATLNPELYAKYVALEKKTGYTVVKGKGLEEVTGIKAA